MKLCRISKWLAPAILVAGLSLANMACTGASTTGSGSTTGDTTGGATGDTTGGASGDTTGGTSGDTTGGTSGDTTGGTSGDTTGSGVSNLLAANPCDEVGGVAYSIFAQDANNIWLGCGGAAGGLFRSADGGASFTQVTEANSGVESIDGDNDYYGEGGDPAPDVRFYDIESDGQGNIYLCGGNNEVPVQNTTSKVFLYRYNISSGTYTVLLTRSIVLALGGTGFSDCDNVIVSGNNIIVDDLAGSQVAYSSDAGVTWSKYTAGQIWDMILVGGDVYGSGGTTGAGPTFFDFNTALSSVTLLDVDNAADTVQDGRVIATPDNGSTFLIGAAFDTQTDSDGSAINMGVTVRYSTDAGATWNDAALGDTSDVSFIRALVCSSNNCFLGGDTYPGSQGRGYIMTSTDGGLNWSDVTLSGNITPIYSASIFGNSAWFAGDGGNIVKVDF